MKILLRKVHCYLYIASVALTYALAFPFLYLLSRDQRNYKYMNAIRRTWGFISSLLVGILYNFDYEQPIDWNKTYIICPNHTSNLDITVMTILVKNNNHCFMGKDELLNNFVTRLFFKTVDIPVNRDSKMSSYRAFKKAGEALAAGISVIIFPEGRIPHQYPPELHDFKNGPFRLAIDLKVPIIPVSSTNTWKVLWDTGLDHGSKPGICNIFVHKPVETANLTVDDADALRDHVHSIIKQKLV
ncbi:1-acyl-sn-glycerol-3-phosphate acyltransferase [Mucilaginibacter corticis]|uniref:1-acyl-sn-glycerol-3-phosphate acyltransferase n=1 Tax=Mucilaginibacter corticis TaxID=2597670 RepID=A0A556ML50_9SPHI|nr:lysophospholipid acyltransferase family protein [Mucilaginibacter corticis]TSJ40613.1 1-acyl-sn-glycerol-3-phosphate acyltransferase [Mucilaginibacter corticis]